MIKFRHPPSKRIRYCSFLVAIVGLVLISIAIWNVFRPEPIIEGTRFIWSFIFLVLGMLSIAVGIYLRRAKRWAWISAIIISCFAIGGPLLPFGILSLVFLLQKDSVAYFNMEHRDPNQAR